MKAQSVLDTIGNTPHIRLGRLFPQAEVWVKSERANPGGSIKDRIGLAMIEAAEKAGRLKPGGTIIEPTSGNTGIGLAMAAAVKGYRLILVMPDSMSIERRRLMQAYGASFELTPRAGGMKGSIARAEALAATTPGAWIPMQFENPANIAIHAETTAREILADFPEGLDALITGVGTGGHITGCAQVLKSAWPGLKVFAVEPSASPVISGGTHTPHPIQGIGAGFVPANLHVALLDGTIQVSGDDAKEYARRSAREEGLLVGISSGATLAAIAQTLPALSPGARVLGFNYDTGERYLSVPDFLPECARGAGLPPGTGLPVGIAVRRDRDPLQPFPFRADLRQQPSSDLLCGAFSARHATPPEAARPRGARGRRRHWPGPGR
ncbi:cysteine synthase A [Siccirubricoccus deserti]|nr:cysteine synthase A [Siccirubricoccus deserti]